MQQKISAIAVQRWRKLNRICFARGRRNQWPSSALSGAKMKQLMLLQRLQIIWLAPFGQIRSRRTNMMPHNSNFLGNKGLVQLGCDTNGKIIIIAFKVNQLIVEIDRQLNFRIFLYEAHQSFFKKGDPEFPRQRYRKRPRYSRMRAAEISFDFFKIMNRSQSPLV